MKLKKEAGPESAPALFPNRAETCSIGPQKIGDDAGTEEGDGA